MSFGFRLVAFAVTLSLALVGPLAPFAVAQQAAPQLPIGQVQPAPTAGSQPAMSAQPAQPALFPEALKTPAPKAMTPDEAYDVGAFFANVFVLPGRAGLCLFGISVGTALLAATIGSGYKASAGVAREGCGGKWIINGDDIKPEPSRFRIFEWEADLWDWEKQ